MSSLEAISGFKLKIDIVQNIINDYTHFASRGKTIILCCIPSHVNIRGNERADTAAKSALSLPITNMKLPPRELLPCIYNFCLAKWQDIWTVVKVINFIVFTPLLAFSSIAKYVPLRFCATQQTSNCSFSSHPLIPIVWWWSSNLSVLWNSTYSKTYISGMCQLAGHSWKILHGVLCRRLV